MYSTNSYSPFFTTATGRKTILHIIISHFLFTAEQTRNSSGDEMANVNFLYDDIVHAVKIQ